MTDAQQTQHADIDLEVFMADIPLSLAVQAFNGTSFSPERRGASVRKEFAQTLAEDYQYFHSQAIKGQTVHLVNEEFAKYRANYTKHYRAWLSSHSHCISSMIAGPSNFPVRRAQKRNEVERKRADACIEFRQKARLAIVRTLRPDLRPIMAGDVDAIERLHIKLAKLEKLQERMKACNAAIRKNAKKGLEAQVQALIELGETESTAHSILKPDYRAKVVGFEQWQLSNNNAVIRDTKMRIERLTAAHSLPVIEKSGDGVRMEDDPPANRIRLIFDDKPAADIRQKLKSNGFRWAPSVGAWQAYRNYNSMQVAQSFVG